MLEWGGGKLETAIGRDLGLTGEEAGDLKHQVSLESGVGDSDDPLVVRARAAVQRETQTLARELVASLQFYQTQPGSLPISEILVTGGTSQLPGLVEELERLTRARVRAADPLSAVQVDRAVGDRDDLASIRRRDRPRSGAVMQAVNLLPEYARQGHRWTAAGSDLSARRILPIGAAAAIGLALIFGLFYFHERSVVSDKKSELATAQAGSSRSRRGPSRSSRLKPRARPGSRSCGP